MSLTASQLAGDDPLPDVHELFVAFNEHYFWGRLGMVVVQWSRRMTLCAGLCAYRGGGNCTIKLSEPLLKFRPRSDLIDTLLHEMIHAYLFVAERNRDHDDHGEQFHAHMHRINAAARASVTVFHSFVDEVDHYRVHWWRCDRCHNVVKRSMNRPPQPADFWFADHLRSCGGAYVKIREPAQRARAPAAAAPARAAAVVASASAASGRAAGASGKRATSAAGAAAAVASAGAASASDASAKRRAASDGRPAAGALAPRSAAQGEAAPARTLEVFWRGAPTVTAATPAAGAVHAVAALVHTAEPAGDAARTLRLPPPDRQPSLAGRSRLLDMLQPVPVRHHAPPAPAGDAQLAAASPRADARGAAVSNRVRVAIDELGGGDDDDDDSDFAITHVVSRRAVPARSS